MSASWTTLMQNLRYCPSMVFYQIPNGKVWVETESSSWSGQLVFDLRPPPANDPQCLERQLERAQWPRRHRCTRLHLLHTVLHRDGEERHLSPERAETKTPGENWQWRHVTSKEKKGKGEKKTDKVCNQAVQRQFHNGFDGFISAKSRHLTTWCSY